MNNHTFGLKDMLNVIFEKWKRIILFALLCAILAGAYKIYKVWPRQADMNTAMEQSTEETALNNATENKQEDSADFTANSDLMKSRIEEKSIYLNNSVLSHINPQKAGYATITIYVNTPELEEENETADEGSTLVNVNQSDSSNQGGFFTTIVKTETVQKIDKLINEYTEFVNSGIDWSELESKYDTSSEYLSELVEIKEGSLINEISINVRYIDSAGAKDILEYIVTQIKEYESDVSSEYGTHTLSYCSESAVTRVDTDLLRWVTDRTSELNNLISNRDTFTTSTNALGLSSTTVQTSVSKKSLIKPILKFSIAGFIGGIILYIICAILKLLFSGKVYSAKEFNRQYGLDKIAYIPNQETNEDKGLNGIFTRYKTAYFTNSSREICYQIALENIVARSDANQCVAILGDVDSTTMENLKSTMLDDNEENKCIKFLILNNVMTSIEELKKLKSVDRVVLVVKNGVTKYEYIDKLVDLLKTYKKGILGSIIMD